MTKNNGNSKRSKGATQQRAVPTAPMPLTADERSFLKEFMKKKTATNDKYESAKSALDVTRALTMSMVTAGVMTPEAATTIVGSAKEVGRWRVGSWAALVSNAKKCQNQHGVGCEALDGREVGLGLGLGLGVRVRV